MTRFCPECLDEVDAKEVKIMKNFQLRGENIELEVNRLQCSKCKEVISDSQLEKDNYKNIYNLYRAKKGFLQPSEIVAIRKTYDLSQRQFARLLGWSHATLSKYENGALQDSSHDCSIKMLQQPENMLLLLENNQDRLTDKEINLLKLRISKMLEENKMDNLISIIEKYFIKEPTRFTGYTKFDLDKVVQTVKYFASLDKHLYKVKLIKYLWYSDFLNFKRTTNSINGLMYVHLPLGPVPDNYDLLLSLVESKEDQVIKEYVNLGYENLGELYKAVDDFDSTLFTEDELTTLIDVYNNFKNDTSLKISERSHQETAWLKTSNKEPIPYDLAFELSYS
jgi:putative zinc finger/helix-turn-helix YgiT family protein